MPEANDEESLFGLAKQTHVAVSRLNASVEDTEPVLLNGIVTASSEDVGPHPLQHISLESALVVGL